MAQWGKLSYAQKSCLGNVGRLMQQTSMVGPGARVGVAMSGGMDSFLLMQIMTMRRRIVPFDFELMALHVNPGFEPGNHAPLANWLKDMGLPGHIEATDHGPRAHSPENRKNSPCFFCAWHRRKALFELCRQYGLTHLALAHTADDLAANFFMNIFETGKVYGMSAKEKFFGGQLMVIRPMLFVEKKTVRSAANRFGLPYWENPCPSTGSTARTRTWEWLREQCAGDRKKMSNVINALRRWQLDLTDQNE